MGILDNLPIWLVYVVTVVLLLLLAEIGFRIGVYNQKRASEDGGPAITNTVVGSMLGLLAFLLAISIGIVIEQHNSRKSMVTMEANAVGTAFLRSGFLEEPDRSTSRELLSEYVDIRLAVAADSSRFDEVVSRSQEIHNQLWAIVEQNVRQGNDSDIMGLYIESVNEVIDVHTLRLRAVDLRLPRLLGILLYVAMMLTFLMIGIVNSADGKRDFAALLLFTLAFVAVAILVVDLDRPQQGLVNVSQAAMTELQQTIRTFSP